MNFSSRKKWVAASVAIGLTAASTLVLAAPASAAPGDASATGISVVVDNTAATTVIGANAGVGAVSVTGSGTQSFSPAGPFVVGSAVPASRATAAIIQINATSDAGGSSASSRVTDLNASLFNTTLFTAGELTANAVCAVGSAPTADAVVNNLTLLGNAVTLSDVTPTVQGAFNVTTGDLAGTVATVELTKTEQVTATTGLATAITARVRLSGTAANSTVFANTLVATTVIASAQCETPAVVPVTAVSLTPNSGSTLGGQTVVITGTGFNPSTTVTIGGAPATSAVVSNGGTRLTVVTPAGAAGLTTAVVANPGSSASLPYTYLTTGVLGFSPMQGPVAGGTTVTLTGVGLQTTTGVTFDGNAATVQSVSPDGTQVVVTTPAGVSGLVDVEVALLGGPVLTAPDQYLYTTVTSPTIAAIAPTAGPTAGGTTVTITGTNLGGVTDVVFDGGNPGTIVGTPTATQIVVLTPANAAGPVDVTLFSPGGIGRATDSFTFVAPPSITSISPEGGPTAGGNTVTIVGGGFFPGGTTVRICGTTIAASAVTVNADGTRLTFAAPACAAGLASVTVTSPGGISAAGSYRYSNGLAKTGSDVAVAPLVAGGSLLLVLGGAAIFFAKRRRTV